MKKPFYKVRVVHDAANSRFFVQTKDKWYKPWNGLVNSFSYEKAYHQMYTEETAERAALELAESISKQTIIAEF